MISPSERGAELARRNHAPKAADYEKLLAELRAAKGLASTQSNAPENDDYEPLPLYTPNLKHAPKSPYR